jgi:MFS family permease
LFSLCRCTWSGTANIFRIIQGIGTAMLLASSPALLMKHLPAERRGHALGCRASFIYLGLAAGPALGGWMAGNYGWRAVFCMQIPIGLVGFQLTQRLIRDDASQARTRRLDFAGSVTWTGGLAALLFGLSRGHVWGWTSPAVLLLLTISAVLLMAFVRVEHGNPDAMVDLTLINRSSFSLPVVTLVLTFVSGYLLAVLLPFCLIQGRHIRPLRRDCCWRATG